MPLAGDAGRRAAMAAGGGRFRGADFAMAAARVLCTALALTAAAAETGPRSVREFGAAGDGKADDTAAFERALAEAAKDPPGRTVRVPPGLYRLTRTLSVESVLLLGLEAGGWPADSQPMPHLVVDVPAPEPCIAAGPGASLHGLEFDHDYARDAGRVFGPCIRVLGGGVSLTNLMLHNPTLGIIADGAGNAGRVNLERVFVVNARRIGVQFEYGLDVITFRNVHVWNYLPELLGTCTGFRIGHADEIRLSDCSVVNAQTGFHFVGTELPDGRTGAAWGGMSNCTADGCGTGVRIDRATVLRISGGSLWAHHFGLVCNGPGDVIVSGADIRANSNHAIDVRETGTLTVTGCLLKKNGSEWPDTAKVNVDGPGTVLVSACSFDGLSAGVSLGPGATCVSLTGNVFAASPYRPIADGTHPACRKVIANNLGAD